MPKDKQIKDIISAQGTEITVLSALNNEDYISLTDIAKYKNPIAPKDVVKNWMRLRSTIEFLGLWEVLNNPNFNGVEFDSFKNASGANAFTLSPHQWISSTNAVGIISKSGRYGGGTFAHTDIAFEFASWISPEFKLYIIKDYQRLKQSENHQLALDWNVKRILAKANYKIHTDAIKKKLIPLELSQQQMGYIYASEADMLNVALFGLTAAQWRKENPDAEGNMRDDAAIEQLLVLANLENANALLIEQGHTQAERLRMLRDMAVSQLERLAGSKSVESLNQIHNQIRMTLPGNEKKLLDK